MDINVNVKISADERLMQVLGAIASGIGGGFQGIPAEPAACTAIDGQLADEQAAMPPADETAGTMAQSQTEAATTIDAPAAEAAQAETPAEGEPMAAAEPVYDDACLIQAIEACRARFEGDDWKENKTGEKRKKYHKALTEMIKLEVKRLAEEIGLTGVDKPTQLPVEGPVRLRFIRTLNEFDLDDKGEITIKCPF